MRRVNLLRAHGSPTGYLHDHHGCRCVACRASKAEYNREYQAEHAAEIAEQRRKYGAERTEEKAEYDRKYHAEHREEIAEYQRKHRAEHAGSIRQRALLRKYGMPPGLWDAMFLSQGERCKCCGADDPGGNRGWHTDHDHETGTVRGILCHRCNVGIGHFRDDPAHLMAAIEYLAQVTP